jgi:hypothetical protein
MAVGLVVDDISSHHVLSASQIIIVLTGSATYPHYVALMMSAPFIHPGFTPTIVQKILSDKNDTTNNPQS